MRASSSMDETVRIEQRDEIKEVRNLARKETKDVRFWLFMVLLLLGVTAGMVSAGTYILLTKQENDNFETSVSVEIGR
jgi:hypothetical protein